MGSEQLETLMQRLDRIEAALTLLVEQRTIKDWYTTAELATMLGRAEYTVREWCRLGRLQAQKLPHGRGNEGEWRVGHDELLRYQREGLRPLAPVRKY